MHKFIILAQSDVGGRTLDAWTRLLALPDRQTMVSAPIVFDERSHQWLAGSSVYDYFVEQFESHVGSPHAIVTVFVDAIRPSDMSLVSETATWDNLVAMLVLTFPECHWAFAYDGMQEVRDRSNSDRLTFPADVDLNTEPIAMKTIRDHVFASHERFSLFRSWVDPLFDPSGLREWIRLQTNADLKQMSDDAGNLHAPFQLPRRRELAAVIEDEQDFGLMHGYAAYRFGFRTDVVTSWRQMEGRFHVRLPQNPSPDEGEVPATLTDDERHEYRLILEDMRLQFPDKSAKTHLSKLDERGIHCNQLADANDDSDFRFMISTGQESDSDDLWGWNDGYLYNKRRGVGKLLAKPIGGPLELWRATKLNQLLEDGVADGFVSPPAEIMDDLYDGHGAPGKLGLVAGTLIDRARRVAANADTPSRFVLSAVLANDAFELLGGKTPTMSLEALRIKITSEVRAECTFIGAGFHVDLDDRFAEIDVFVESVCRWYQKKERRWCEWDAKAMIYNELVKIYRDAGQVEEEDRCLAEFRALNRKLERPRGLNRANPFAWGMHAVLAYAEWMLVDLWRIIIAFSFWVLLFSLISSIYTGYENPFFYLAKQLNWMVGGGAYDVELVVGSGESYESTPTDSFFAPLSIVSNLIGVFHFGILMSYLYSLISRK